MGALGKVLGGLLLLGLVIRIVEQHPGPAIAVGVLVLFVSARRLGGRARRVVGHSHAGAPRLVADHEAGHYVAARFFGERDVQVRTWPGGGECTSAPGSGTKKVVEQVAIFRAGRRAARSGAGCAGDDDLVRGALRAVPREHRRQVERDGDDLARRIVRQRGGEVRRAAAMIRETGRIG